MNKWFLIFAFLLSSAVQAEDKRAPVCHKAEIEQLLRQYQEEVQEGRELSLANRRLIERCLKKIKEQEKRLQKNDFLKIALLLKLGVVVCLYQNYQNPGWIYKIAGLVCFWLV